MTGVAVKKKAIQINVAKVSKGELMENDQDAMEVSGYRQFVCQSVYLFTYSVFKPLLDIQTYMEFMKRTRGKEERQSW